MFTFWSRAHHLDEYALPKQNMMSIWVDVCWRLARLYLTMTTYMLAKKNKVSPSLMNQIFESDPLSWCKAASPPQQVLAVLQSQFHERISAMAAQNMDHSDSIYPTTEILRRPQ